jgi:CHAD domain-containing protein
MTETFAALKKQFAKKLPSCAWREIKRDLSAVHRQSAPRKRKAMATVVINLRTARNRVEQWPLGFEDEAVLQAGLRKAYQRGRRAMEQALEEPTAENFHEWRKQVNHLRHQLQILQNLKIGKVRTALREFKALAKILGLNNDLAVLSRHLHQVKRKTGASARQALQELIHTRHVALETEADQLGQKLYQPKPKAFIKQIWS